MEKILRSSSTAETEVIGAKIARFARKGDIIGLGGELGAGKTVFARGALAALGLPPHTPVLSPTFTIINSYELAIPVFHIDCYRLQDEKEFIDIGLQDIIKEGIAFVEWFDKFPSFFAQIALRVNLIIESEESRAIILRGDKRFSIE
ncbi:MAG: tRNA (adenosine(37)-N6)-threonylcarbamoyltransferase complex ATPase subunit type 1 TsaE [Myxococcota bacterium]